MIALGENECSYVRIFCAIFVIVTLQNKNKKMLMIPSAGQKNILIHKKEHNIISISFIEKIIP